MSTIDEFTLKPAGELAPPFRLPDQEGNTASLEQLTSSGLAMLYFYSQDGAPGVTEEVLELDAYRERFAKLGITPVAISNDDQEIHKTFAETHHLSVRLLADPDYAVAREYGVYNKSGVNSRVTFLIDQDREIVRVYPSRRMRPHIREIYQNIRETMLE